MPPLPKLQQLLRIARLRHQHIDLFNPQAMLPFALRRSRSRPRRTPTDPKLVAELTQVSTSLDGMYGKGKYCRSGSSGTAATSTEGEGEHCLGIEEIDVLMAKSRDPKELLELWQGWHKISPPMREKYARLVELSNQGAREFGFKDTGDLWRSGYDMKPDELSAELERTWKKLEPLYRELNGYWRCALMTTYGSAAPGPTGR